MTTLYLPAESRNAWWRDASGMWTTIKPRDSIMEYDIDWSAVLGEDAIVTSTWAAVSGDLEFSDLSTTSPTTTATVTKNGIAKNTITTLEGNTYIKYVNFRSPDCVSHPLDYRPY